jgi:uncharacterized protein YprB with RNaseH-like and TPR domain
MIDLASLPKAEIIRRAKWKCPTEGHSSHNGLEHPRCYDKAIFDKDEVAFFDVETSNLKSTYGIVFSYALKSPKNAPKLRVLTSDEVRGGLYDKALISELCEDLRLYRRIISYYGAKFDIPFIRSRAVYHRLNFPTFRELMHTDAYFVIKHKFGTVHSKRLGVVCDFYGIKAKQHPLKPSIWHDAMAGNPKALQYIGKHNAEDVVSLEKLWERISPYTSLTNTSI